MSAPPLLSVLHTGEAPSTAPPRGIQHTSAPSPPSKAKLLPPGLARCRPPPMPAQALRTPFPPGESFLFTLGPLSQLPEGKAPHRAHSWG